MTSLKVIYCRSCGKAYISPVYNCESCGEGESALTEELVSNKGTVISYSTVWVAPEMLKEIAPYLLAIVEVKDGARLLGRFAEKLNREPSIGMKVEVEKGEKGEYLLKAV